MSCDWAVYNMPDQMTVSPTKDDAYWNPAIEHILLVFSRIQTQVST